MCIIAAKPAGVKMPSDETIRNMWYANPDGAGIMYALEGKVRIEKGFMKLTALESRLAEIRKTVNLDETGVVLHFRITTHGGTRPENCHPFPITDSLARLRMTRVTTSVGVAHNGVIHIAPRDRNTSDTMEYIASQLAPLSRALPSFYVNPNAMTLIQNAIQSRMAFLTGSGEIYMTGDFIESDGIFYSNRSFKGYGRARGCYVDWDDHDAWDDYGDRRIGAAQAPGKNGKGGKKKKGKSSYTIQTMQRPLMWIVLKDDGAYVITKYGAVLEGDDFLIDADGHVYEYDTSTDLCVLSPDANAFTNSGLPLRFDPNYTSMEYILT